MLDLLTAPATLLSLAPAPIVQSTPGDIRTFQDFLESGGPLMIPIGICSVVVVGLLFERLVALRRSAVCPSALTQATAAVREGRLDEAGELAATADAPGTRILSAGLRRRGYSVRDVERAMEDQAAKEIERLRANVRPISLVAAVAPLLGLLGTVIGIADSFHGVVTTGMGEPEALAGGINEALTTTICGLSVAIPALLVAAWLDARVRRLVAHADGLLAPTVEAIAARPESLEPGHAA
jgi:biopolymer transport protein ExbB